MESQRIEFTFEEYPLLNMGTLYRRHNKFDYSWVPNKRPGTRI